MPRAASQRSGIFSGQVRNRGVHNGAEFLAHRE